MGRKYVMQEDEDLFETRFFFNKLIDSIKSETFKEVEDIDLDNLREFLILVLQSLQEKKFDLDDILDIIDALETYLHRRYMDEWPENHYPVPPDSDPLSIGLNALDYIKQAIYDEDLQPKTFKRLLTYLKTPLGQQEKATKTMEKYMEEMKKKWRKKEAREDLTSS